MSSSRKRTRDANDIDSEVELESASSSFRHNIPKRSRVALAAENGGSVVSDDEDEVNGYMPHGVHYDVDGGDTIASLSDMDDSDDEIDELRATQFVERQMRQHRENIASDNGVIEEVYCRNFMCHTKLRIRLGPLINFIIGHNGSGKSAVLTALTMCLGGKATTTNRGASLKSLIKEGEESSTLQVKIKNRGDGAYKLELYGRSIIVERNFSRSGTSGFKLKNSEDKTITTKKADLDDILDFFAFQLDNPINVLTQDMARQFLSNSSPADKYKFFIRGTQLETLDNDYKILEEHLDNMQIKLNSRQDDIKILRDKLQQAEARKKRLERAATITEKLKRLKWQHAWAQVGEQEVFLEKRTEELEKAEELVREREEAAETVSGTFDGHDQAYEASEGTVRQLKEQLVPVQAQYDTEREKFKEAKAELEGIHTQQREIRDHLRASKNRIKTLEEQTTEERNRIAAAEGPEHTDRLNRLEELQAAADEAKRKHEAHLNKRDELEARRNNAGRAHDLTRGPLDHAKDEVTNAERQLLTLQRSQGRPLDGYPRNMDQLVRAVDNETRWRQKPVGPMGRHVRLLKPQWSSQIERTFGAVLNSFVVTNNEDQRLLRDMMRRFNLGELTIYLGDPQPLDTTDKVPDDPNVDTILSVLNIDNDLVRNQLIINQAIEQTVLIENLEAGGNFMFKGSRKRNVKVTMCKAAIPGAGHRLEFSRAGQQKTSRVPKWEGPIRMQTDRQEQINHAQEAVHHYERLKDAAAQKKREAQESMNTASQALKRWENEERVLKTKAQESEDAVERQNNEIEANRPQDGKLQELERQLADAKGEFEAHGSSFQDSVNQKDTASAKSKDAKAQLDAAERELKAGTTRVNDAEERKTRLANDRHAALMAKNTALNEIESAKQEATRCEQARDEAKGVVETYIGHATQVCLRVPVDPGNTTDKLDAMISKLSDDIQAQRRAAGGNELELAEAYSNAKIEHDDAVAQLAGLEKLGELLVKSLAYRQFRWKHFRRYISYRARITFGYLLSERNFRGRVILDHADKQLDIAVEPDLSKRSDAGREARTLSGGEKSFSTICLLLAIWEAMGSPIRCLDEFDVFMDSVNRATSMQMMIQAARRSVGRQFILITPQSMNNVDRGDDVSIHKMSDPERGQQALPSQYTRD